MKNRYHLLAVTFVTSLIIFSRLTIVNPATITTISSLKR